LSLGDYMRAFRHTNILIRVTAFIFVLMAVIQVGASLLVCKTTEMGVTNRRLVLKRGLVSRRVEEIRTEYVESADMNQGIMGRIFDFGQVKVYGTGTEEIFFPKYTADPVGFRRAIQTARAHHIQPVSVVANPAAKNENNPVSMEEVSDSAI